MVKWISRDGVGFKGSTPAPKVARREFGKMDVEQAILRVTQALARHPQIMFAYLFGSVARGEARPGSDLDLAIEIQAGGRAHRVWLDALAGVGSAIDTVLVDCVDLSAAPLPLRFAVIREGRVLLDRDPAARRRFEVDTRREYWDFEPWRRRHDEELLRRLREGTYGIRSWDDRSLAPR